ncbi:MAG TPA: ferredoxin:thioredoxin reductase [candidate division WOR-3 bacterium]|uniref:Ferredoxin:thioredoxin reductase n=1 Tax=candidate division WOR-3 bacterium TaxID=2052148 RepID=A0A7V0T7K5_UNCW3|nr:ferredoxin:thioredoxin reductase [candidate division WOR-3 bacterium]
MELSDNDRVNLERARRVADKLGLVLNPNRERALKVATLLAKNHAEHGKYYCPCKQSHPLDPAKDTVCPCPTLTEEIAADGHCFCKLFYTTEAAGAAGAEGAEMTSTAKET